jgi:hypothetical protein
MARSETRYAVAAWHAPATGERGGQPVYSAIAIETSLALRLVFHQPLRQTEGLLRSIADVFGINIAIPDHTTLSRRGGGLRLPRRINAASYSDQFVTRYLAFGILWRRLSLNLYGMGSTVRSVGRHSLSDDIVYPTVQPQTSPSVQVIERSIPDRRARARTHPPHNLRSIHAPTRHDDVPLAADALASIGAGCAF